MYEVHIKLKRMEDAMFIYTMCKNFVNFGFYFNLKKISSI